MMAGVHHLGFLKDHNCIGQRVFMPNFLLIWQSVAELWQFIGFQNGCRSPSWIS